MSGRQVGVWESHAHDQGCSPQTAAYPSSVDRLWPWICGLAATLLAVLISDQVFGRIPHVPDSIAQLFQARILAAGRLWWPAPPLMEFFEYAEMSLKDGRWYSQHPPGHPMLLVPGVWAGAPWIINPLLAGLTVAGACILARDLFGAAVARVTGLLSLLSPFFLIMAGEFVSHSGGLFAATWFLVFLFRAMRTGRQSHGIAAGAFLCLAVLVRPYSALGVAAPFLLHAAWSVLRRGSLLPAGLWIAAGGAAGVILLGLYNWGTTGDPFLPGYAGLRGESHGPGFGSGSWGPPHTLARGLAAAGQSVVALNGRLFEWPVSSLWPLIPALIPAATCRAMPLRLLLLSGPLCLLLLNIFCWHHDLSFGPRYLYESLAPVLILSALGLLTTGGWLARLTCPAGRGWMRILPTVVLVLLLSGYAGAVRIPALFRMSPEAAASEPGTDPRMASYFQRFGREYWGVSPYLGELVEQQVRKPALVFTRFLEPEFPLPRMEHLWFGSAFARMEPDFRGAGVVYAKDLGDVNRRMADMFPRRSVYLYTGSMESGRLQLLRGPLSFSGDGGPSACAGFGARYGGDGDAGILPAAMKSTAQPMEPGNARVVVTTTMIGAAVSDLASDWCRVDVLIPPAGCPGYFDIGPQVLAALQGAAAVFHHDYQGQLRARLAEGEDSGDRFVMLATEGSQTLPGPYLDLCEQVAEALKARFPGRTRVIDASLDSLAVRLTAFAEATAARSRPLLKGMPLLTARYQSEFVEWAGGTSAAGFPRGDDMSMREIRDLLGAAREAGVQGVVGNLQWGEREVHAMAEDLRVPGVVLSSYPFLARAGAWEDLMRGNVELLLSLIEDD